MLSPEELPEYINRSYPELSAVCGKDNCNNIYDVVRQLLKYTSKQIRQHNTVAARKCLSLADNLHKKGNTAIRNAIENVFIYSFTHAFFTDEKQRQEILGIVPDSLYALYKKQVLYSHL